MAENMKPPCDYDVSCPRCGGCGFEDCEDCEPTRAKRSDCWRCGGMGRVRCEQAAGHDTPHGTHVEKAGEVCSGCDQLITDPEGCSACWQPVPDNLADQKAMFAEMGLSLTREDD